MFFACISSTTGHDKSSSVPVPPSERVVMVYFLGGCTFAEINALRLLGKLKSKALSFLFQWLWRSLDAIDFYAGDTKQLFQGGKQKSSMHHQIGNTRFFIIYIYTLKSPTVQPRLSGHIGTGTYPDKWFGRIWEICLNTASSVGLNTYYNVFTHCFCICNKLSFT